MFQESQITHRRIRLNKHHSILLFGRQGAGKTAFLELLVRELLKKFPGKQARLATCEHYGSMNRAIQDGLVEVWRVNTRPHPFETSRRSVQGYWPERPEDPESPLLAPTKETFEQFPIRIYEGIGTYGNYISSNHIEGGLLQRAGLGDIIGPVQEHVQFMDGDEGVGGACWTHYRVGQSELLGLVQSSQAHPGYTIWTSHEDSGKDGGIPFIGPQVYGNKMTGEIGKEFDDLYHIGTVGIDFDENGETRRITERRLYLKEHFLPGGSVPYISKNSASLLDQDKIPDYIRLSENGLPLLDAPAKLIEKVGF